MRILIYFLAIFLTTTPALAQSPSAADKTVKPSQKEMQAQLTQMKREAQERIIALEKDIAEAKANNEDPESIKQLETQLATLRQIVGGVDNMASQKNKRPETLAPATIKEPKYVSPFEPIVLKQPVTAPTKDQAKDQLFWYKGKKVDANTIVTTNRTIVRYNRTNNSLIIQTDKPVDTSYYGLLSTLSQTSQIRNDFVAAEVNRLNSFFMYPEIQKAYDDFTVFRERYYDLGKNSVKLHVSSEPLEVLHHQLVISMSTLPSPQNVPAAPERPNNLCDCSSNERELYERNLAQWFEAFCHDENGLLYLLEAIYLDIHSAGAQGYSSLSNTPNLRADIVKAFDLVLERLTQKLQDLSNKYQPSNVAIEDGLVLMAMYLQKLNFQTFAETEEQSTKNLKRAAHIAFEEVKNLVVNNTVFEKYVNDQKAALNFNAVLEYRLYESHEMNKKALSRSTDVDKNLEGWVDKLDKYNRFSLSMKLDLDYVFEGDGQLAMESTAQLQSDYMIVTLGRDECSWHLSLKDPDHTDRSGAEENYQIPFTVQPGASKFIKGVGTFGYTGPAKMNMISPVFKINLCPNASNDQAYVEGLRFSDADLAAHSNDDYSKVYTTDLFQYVNKMFVSVMGTKDNSAMLVSNAFEAMNISNGNTNSPSTGNANLDKLKMLYLMWQKKSKMLQNATQTTHTRNTVVPFDAQNGNGTLISTTYSMVDPSDPDRQYGIKMKKADITITVTHSPL
jgi:hypothetical protein